MSEEEIKTGYYLQQTLLDKRVSKRDITSLLTFVLNIPEKDYEKGFFMSPDVRFALNGLQEEYNGLSRKYEPSIEYVLFNTMIHEEIINSLKKLAGKRNNSADSRAIEAVQDNLMIERYRAKIDEEFKQEGGSFLQTVKHILKKNRLY